MTSQCSISVIIPTYQRCASVQRALRALALQTVSPCDYEVIVSIDGSEDDTLKRIVRSGLPYPLRVNWQTHLGRAAACNAGIELAQGDLLVFLDDDMEPVPEFLAAHIRAHKGRERLGVMGAAPIPLSRSSPPIVEYFGTKFNSRLKKLAKPGYKIHCQDFYSGNFSIHRNLLRAIGGFEETFEIHGNQDGELALRMLRADIPVVYSADALAYKDYSIDFAALARNNIAKGETDVLLANLHPDAFYDLAFGTYRQGSQIWRLVRSGLLQLSQRWAGLPDWVIWYVSWLERRGPNQLYSYYHMALDYFYWLGARSAMQKLLRITLQADGPAKLH